MTPFIDTDFVFSSIDADMSFISYSRFENLEKEIYRSSARQIPGTPEWFMAASTKTKVVAKNISRIALISEEATKYLAQKYQLSRDQITFGLPTADVRGTILGDVCPVKAAIF